MKKENTWLGSMIIKKRGGFREIVQGIRFNPQHYIGYHKFLPGVSPAKRARVSPEHSLVQLKKTHRKTERQKETGRLSTQREVQVRRRTEPMKKLYR